MKLLASWKTTVQSILTLILALSGVSIPAGLLTTKQALWWTAITGAAKVILGVFQQDADKALATTPSDPKPHVVQATPVPLDPQATPVKE